MKICVPCGISSGELCVLAGHCGDAWDSPFSFQRPRFPTQVSSAGQVYTRTHYTLCASVVCGCALCVGGFVRYPQRNPCRSARPVVVLWLSGLSCDTVAKRGAARGRHAEPAEKKFCLSVVHVLHKDARSFRDLGTVLNGAWERRVAPVFGLEVVVLDVLLARGVASPAGGDCVRSRSLLRPHAPYPSCRTRSG